MNHDPKSTICRYRWDYPIVGFDQKESRLCCKVPKQAITPQEIEKHGSDAFLNNDYLIERRYEMLKGIRHKDCNSCWKLEDGNATSMRMSLGYKDFMQRMQNRGLIPEEFHNDFDGFAKSVTMDSPVLRSYNPDMLEISVGNFCDMKCMYCNHRFSTQWAIESIKYGDITQEFYDSETSPDNVEDFEKLFWQWFYETGRHSVRKIIIIGGEPLIIPKFYEIVDNFMEAYKDFAPETKPLFSIVTNMNTPKLYFDKFINMVPQITNVFDFEIQVSMESLGKQAEYIRNGLNFKRFEGNIKNLLSKQYNIGVGFQIAINALSVPYMKDLLVWIKGLADDYNYPISLKTNTVVYPEFQSPLVLTPDFATYILEAVEWLQSIDVPEIDAAMKYHGKWSVYIKFLSNLAVGILTAKPDIQKRKNFYKWFTQYDERRKLNFLETFPIHKDFWETCKNAV